MTEHQRQALLRRTRTLLTEVGYDLTGVTDSHLDHCLTGFLAALEGFGARAREGEAEARSLTGGVRKFPMAVEQSKPDFPENRQETELEG